MTKFILCTKIRTKIILVVTSNERLPQLYYKEIQQCISHKLSYASKPYHQPSIFQIGQTFSSFDGLERTKSTYETKHFCQLVKRDCRTFEAAKKENSQENRKCKQVVCYQSIKYVCKFSGKPRDSDLKRKRTTKSFRSNGPFALELVLSQNNQEL